MEKRACQDHEWQPSTLYESKVFLLKLPILRFALKGPSTCKFLRGIIDYLSFHS